MTGAHSQEKGLILGIEKPPTQPLRIRILSERRIKSGSEAAKRQRSGHVVHMTGTRLLMHPILGIEKPPTQPLKPRIPSERGYKSWVEAVERQ